jgi:fatty acid desaturase
MVELSERETMATSPSPADREWARARVEKKHKLRGDFVAYVVINLALIGAWAATGFGYFWPGWILGIWGVFLLLDAWNLYYRRPVTEDEVDRELCNHH